jgi:1,4-alpha-glucan branching enzyme
MSQQSTGGRKRVVFEFRAEAGSKVFVAGTFNGWSAKKNRLKEVGEGTFRALMLLPKGRHEYKFVMNGVWCVDPNCPEWAPNDMGSLNSVLIVE